MKQLSPLLCCVIAATFSGYLYADNGISNPERKETWVFQNGMVTNSADVPDYACYRIPAIVKLTSGELLAFAEGRQFGCGDHDANIDIVMRKRDTNGVWGDVSIVASHGSKVTRNPAPVVDENGTVHMLYNVNYDSQSNEDSVVSEGEINQNNNRYRASVYYVSSQDGGDTWAVAQNIDNQVHPNRAHSSYAEGLWTWYAMTPGHAIKLENNRLYFPANHSESAHALGENNYRSYSHGVIYDPANGSFSLTASVGADTNEVTAAELDNGWLYMNMRNNHRSIGAYRAVSFSDDEGNNWMGTTFGHEPITNNYWANVGYDSALITPRVQGSVLRYTSEKDETGVSRLLFSNPASTSSRTDGTIRVSYDEGKTWSYSYRYFDHLSMYSDLVVTDDDDIGILFERSSGEGDTSYSAYRTDEGIYYIETNLEQITNSEDAYIATASSALYQGGIDPSTGSVSIDHAVYLDPQASDMTVSVIFELDQDANTNATQFIARKGNLRSSNSGWGVFIEGGNIKFRANENGNRYGVQASIGNQLDDREAKHTLSVVFDRSAANGMRISLDGVELTTTGLYDNLGQNISISTTENMILGGSDGNYPLDGKLHGYRVYGNALTEETLEVYAESATKDYDYSAFFTNNFDNFFN